MLVINIIISMIVNVRGSELLWKRQKQHPNESREQWCSHDCNGSSCRFFRSNIKYFEDKAKIVRTQEMLENVV